MMISSNQFNFTEMFCVGKFVPLSHLCDKYALYRVIYRINLSFVKMLRNAVKLE